MASRAHRRRSGPPASRPLCPIPGCGVSRVTMSDIHQHVRDAHSSVRLTQPQLDAQGAQYCDICNVFVCSANNDGARHQKGCRQRHNAAAVQAGQERAAPRPGHSRSRSPLAERNAYSVHPALPTAQPFGGFVERPLAEPRRPQPPRLSLGGAPADDLKFPAQIENNNDLLVPMCPA